MSTVNMRFDGRGHEEETPSRSIMPPYCVLRDFLEQEIVSGLLDYALSRQSDFEPTRLRGGEVHPSYRRSLGLRDLGHFRSVLETRILNLVPKFIAELRVTNFANPVFETELVAHGDQAFYRRHVDTQTQQRERPQIRILSGVYYFHAEPKAFTGGALRLYAIGPTDGGGFVDVEPIHNTLLVFPSWAPHEVMPVSCPSQQFANSRFAVNCWISRTATA